MSSVEARTPTVPLLPTVLVAGTACAWLFALALSPAPVTALLANVGTGSAAFIAGFTCWWSLRRRQARDRLAWALIGASAISWGAGQALWTVYEQALGRELPFPSLADVGFLLALPLAAAGLLALAEGGWSVAGRGRSLLDGLLLGAAVLGASWVLVLQPVYDVERGQGIVTAIALAYPVGDAILLAVLASVVMTAPAARRQHAATLGLVAAAIGALAVADSGFAYLTSVDAYATGSVVDVGWGLGYLLLALAGTTSARPPEAGAAPSSRVAVLAALPSIAVLIAVATGAITIARTGEVDLLLAFCGVAMLGMLVVRQLLALRENVELTDALHARLTQLRSSEQRFRALVQHSSDAIAIVDPTGVVRHASDSCARVLGHRADTLLGRPLGDHLLCDGASRLRQALTDRADVPRSAGAVFLDLRDADGQARALEVTITNLLDEPAVAGLVLNMRDVSQQHHLAAQLAHEAYHDSLTGLANRTLFKERVEHLLSGTPAVGRSGGLDTHVLFLDLDGFKVVNDSLGHAAGDVLLQQVAERLRGCVRPGDLVARLGGDEFAVLVEGARGPADSHIVAERILTALDTPFTVAGHELRLTGSIGIATASEGRAAVDELLRNADLAMYRAKATGGNTHEAFDETMHAALVERVQLEQDLARAVERGELVLHYQPTFEIVSGRVTGVEALVRWQHPERGLLLPGAFMPHAEASGLILPLGKWVLEEACRQAAAWQRDLPVGPLTMNVNVSGAQLGPAFPGEVAAALRASGLPGEQLVLELTESMLVDSPAHLEVLHAIKALGVRLAIDDFGTGYSSLGSLHRCPVDVLKIDRSFVQRITDDAAAREMIGAMVQLARSLSLITVAEGIETEGELAELARLACQLGQGYHVARPAPAAEVAARLVAASTRDVSDAVA